VVPRTVTARPSRRIDNTGIVLIVILCGAILGGLLLAKWFNRASEQVQDEIPKALEKLTAEMKPEEPGSLVGQGEITGKGRELLMKAQDAYREGKRPVAIQYYKEFLSAFPEHPETEGVRIQLARLLVAEGDTQMALRVLDDQISSGRRASMIAYARLEKIRIHFNIGNKEEARWECIYLEPNYRKLASPELQMEYLSIYASICKNNGANRDALRLYDTIIKNYTDTRKILEARMLKADIYIEDGNMLDAQRELWVVRDQSRPDTLLHKNAVEKLGSLGLGDAPPSRNY